MVKFLQTNQGSGAVDRALGPDCACGWARGLQQLYSGVIEEPIPADLTDLLTRLKGAVPRGSGNRW